MADVFISYHENSAGTLAQQIADTLESAGMSCWVARRDMPFGADFADEIPPQIDDCKVFLLLLNENAPQSRHIRSEMGLAFGRYNADEDIKILPLKLGEFERKPWIRYFLNQVQITPFSAQPDAQELNQLAARVAQLLNRELPLLKPDPPQPRIIGLGECGNNVTYTLYEDGRLVIFGSGPMRFYQGDQLAPWYPQQDKISDVRIQQGVTSIGNVAFWCCKSLKSVSIPNSVTSIGEYAFYGCNCLASVSIPNSVTFIGVCAFEQCTSLTSVRIPDNVRYIGWAVFQDCVKLTSVNIPDSVTSIGPHAFYHCRSLRSIRIPDSVTSIGDIAFGHCESLTSISVPAKVKIGLLAFDRHTTVTRRKR